MAFEVQRRSAFHDCELPGRFWTWVAGMRRGAIVRCTECGTRWERSINGWTNL